MAMSLEDELKTLRHAMELVEKQRDGLRRDCENLTKALHSAVNQCNLKEESQKSLKEQFNRMEKAYQDAVSDRDELEEVLKDLRESTEQNQRIIRQLKKELADLRNQSVIETGEREIIIKIKVGR